MSRFPGKSEGSFDYNSLVSLGILYCRDHRKSKFKAVELYNLLQKGGVEKHLWLSAGDKDMRPVFFKLFDIATVHAFSEHAAKVEGLYT